MKSFKVVCITLAFVLLFGALGFGGYKLFEKFDSDNTTHADNVAKIYNVDVSAFDYSLENVEGGLIDGVLVSEGIDVSTLTSTQDYANLLNSILVNEFAWKDPNDSDGIETVYTNGNFVATTSSYLVGYTMDNWSSTAPSYLFYVYVEIIDDSLFIHFQKNGGTPALDSIESPDDSIDNFRWTFKDGYTGKKVVLSRSAKWMQVDVIESDSFKASMTTDEMEDCINEMFTKIYYYDTSFDLITSSFNESSSGFRTYSYVSSFGTGGNYYGWYAFENDASLTYLEHAHVYVKFFDGYCYLVMDYSSFASPSTTLFTNTAYGLIFDTQEEAENDYFSQYSYELSDGYVSTGNLIVPGSTGKFFYNGLQVDNLNTFYSFDNLNQAKEMLGITDSDGKFSMTARTDYEDYTEYVFNLSTDNMSLDFTVKVYKDNVCVLDYDKYYYVDKDGVIQTFSLEDITAENSPFVYYYETQTDYYYLRRIDVLTSYQLKISKEILSLNLNKEVA